MPTPGAAVVRLLVATTALSLAALGVAVYAALRPPPAAAASAPDELAAIRRELAAVRHGLDLTRSQQSAPGPAAELTDIGRRLARLEANTARPAAPTPASTSPRATDDPAVMADGTPRFTAIEAPSRAIEVRQSPGGSLTVENHDPALTGQLMIVKGRTADGRVEDVAVTIPPPS
ncbi:MAG: hypothetical protein JNL82_09750 [Myxococcales bacterium]|nr:hypothetical protein [Myxococcales bacterium]